MTLDELAPFLGYACLLRLHCRACGAVHLLTGMPWRGKYVDAFFLEGHSFLIEDIEQIWRQRTPAQRRSLWRMFFSRLWASADGTV